MMEPKSPALLPPEEQPDLGTGAQGSFGEEQEFAISDPASFPAPPRDASEDVRQQMREAALSSHYYLAKTILGYDKLRPEPHGELCAFLDFLEDQREEGNFDLNRSMTLMPRDTYKTTIATIVRAMKRALKDPNTRGLIVMDTAQNAERVGTEISNHFKYNELLRWLWSELIPDNFNTAKWNEKEMVLKRSAPWSAPTFDLIGAFGGIESRHYDWIIPDDLVTEKAMRSTVEMDKLIKWLGGLEPLLVNDVASFIDFVGSRKKKGDAYEFVLKWYEAPGDPIVLGPHAVKRGGICVYSRGIIEEGKVIFPYDAERRSGISRAYIERMRHNDPERFWAQLANSPKGTGLNTFDIEWARMFQLLDDGTIEAWHEGECLFRGHWNTLDRVVLFDPSVAEHKSSSKQAMHVVAKGSGPFRFVLESHVGHFPPDEAVDLLFELDKRWRPSLISIERRGFQGWVKYWLNDRANLLGLPYLPVVEWPAEGSPKSQWSKGEHIRALQPPMRAGFWWFLPEQHELLEEIEFYPNIRWDDGLDALAQHLDYAPYAEDSDAADQREKREDTHLRRIGGTAPDRETRKQQEWDEAKFLASLDSTGYRGRILKIVG